MPLIEAKSIDFGILESKVILNYGIFRWLTHPNEIAYTIVVTNKINRMRWEGYGNFVDCS